MKKYKYGLKVGLRNPILINVKFYTKKESEKWAKWNYKGRTTYKIVKLAV